MAKGPSGTEFGRLSSKQKMDSAQPTKLDFLAVPATPFSIGVLASVLVLVAVLIGPKVVIDTILNVSLLSSFSLLRVWFLIPDVGLLVSRSSDSSRKWKEVHVGSGVHIPQWADGRQIPGCAEEKLGVGGEIWQDVSHLGCEYPRGVRIPLSISEHDRRYRYANTGGIRIV